MKLYGIYDVVKASYAPPFVARNDKDATRMFLMDCKKLPFINDLRLRCLCDIDLDNELSPLPCASVSYEVPIDFGEEK